MHHRVILSFFCLSAAACGAAQPTSVGIEETAIAPPPAAEENAPAKSQPPLPGQIRRADLSAILSRGPGGVLTLVETEPYRESGRFVGFKIARFVEGAPKAVDLREGDILLSVNGLKIASPDDYYRAFQELQVASELRFDVLRDGAPKTLAYPIIE